MYKNCLTRQINELESLQAMYCGPNELTLWNESEFENLKLTIQGKSRVQADDLPQVAFQLQLPLDAPHPADASLVFRVTMPAFYPSSDSVEVHISLDSLTPQQEKDLRVATNTYIETKLGQECILDLVQFAKEWVYDNATPIALPSKKTVPQQKTTIASPAPTVAPVIAAPTPTPVSTILTLPPTPVSSSNSNNNKPCTPSPAPVASAKKPAPAPQKVKAAPKGKNTPQAPKEQEFRRILIWFSTIAPDRAKTIAEWAKQLGLTGISRLGSPALIVVEGQKEDVDEYVSSLRSYRWKKMEIVWEDKMKSTNTNALRRFTNFQECMMSLPDLQLVFKKAGLEDMYKEGLKIRG